MWILLIPLAAIAALIGGIVLIVKRQDRQWRLWTGIGLLVLFTLCLPLTVPTAFLSLLLITGGSFGA